MPVTSNPQQLILVKQLYEDGCLLAAREDDVSLTKAIILVDLAIEQMLNQVLRDFYLCARNAERNAANTSAFVGMGVCINKEDRPARPALIIGLSDARPGVKFGICAKRHYDSLAVTCGGARERGA
jgi:hypothetical protein